MDWILLVAMVALLGDAGHVADQRERAHGLDQPIDQIEGCINLLKPCGRGVYFMKQVMDTVEMRSNGEGSTLVLVKNRRHAEATEI